MTLTALRSPVIDISLFVFGFMLHWLWIPLFHMYLGIVALNLLNVIVTLGVGTIKRGWRTVRSELSEEMERLREDGEAEAKESRTRIETIKAELRDEEPEPKEQMIFPTPSIEDSPGKDVVVTVTVMNGTIDESPRTGATKLRAINGGRK